MKARTSMRTHLTLEISRRRWWLITRWQDLARNVELAPLRTRMGSVRITSWYWRLSGSHFCLATQLCPQDDWTVWQFHVNYGVCAHAPLDQKMGSVSLSGRKLLSGLSKLFIGRILPDRVNQATTTTAFGHFTDPHVNVRISFLVLLWYTCWVEYSNVQMGVWIKLPKYSVYFLHPQFWWPSSTVFFLVFFTFVHFPGHTLKPDQLLVYQKLFLFFSLLPSRHVLEEADGVVWWAVCLVLQGVWLW